MPNFWRLINKVIRDSDILLLVLDARMPNLTRNKEVEVKVGREGKKMLYVLNKSDLVPKEVAEKTAKRFTPCIFVSSKERLGATKLAKKILELSKGENCTVGVLGYPNVGKSSVINLLKGKGSAPVSSTSGYTRSLQFVRARKKIKLIDTPGVLSYKEKSIEKRVMIGSINPQQLDGPDYYAMKLIEQFPKLFESYYDEKYKGDALDFLERVTLKRKILMKGGEADLERFGRKLLQDWQKGRMHEQD